MSPFRFASSSPGERSGTVGIGAVWACRVALLALTSLVTIGATRVRAAEFCFGSSEVRDSRTVAVLGETWTFDHGGPDSLEGWTGTKPWGPVDREVIGWAHLDDFADDGLPPGMPIIEGEGMLWCGVHAATADSLCYLCGMGYGEGWCQQMVSPPIAYTGGSVTLDFEYWRVPLGAGLAWSLETDDCIVQQGSASGGGSPSDPLFYQVAVQAAKFAACGADSFRLSILVPVSGPGDSDCTYDTPYGAFGVDNVVLSGGASASFDFEAGAQGWEFGGLAHGLYGSPEVHVGPRDLGSYPAGYDEWPDCPLDGNVLGYHNLETGFSYYFRDFAYTPVIDLTELDLLSLEDLTLRFDQLQDYDLPFYDPGIWRLTRVRYYPDTCSVTGRVQWSPWHTTDATKLGGVAACEAEDVPLLEDIETGQPVFVSIPDSLQVGMEVEVCRGCALVDDDPSNVTPFFDNLQVCLTGSSVAEVEADPVGSVDESWLAFDGPNPLSPSSSLRLRLAAAGPVETALFDLAGRRVASLRTEVSAPGETIVSLGALLGDPAGKSLASGSYLLQVRAGASSASRRVVIAN